MTLSVIGMAIKAVLQAFFGSLWNRLFPARTASEQKADDLETNLSAEKRMAVAAAESPTDKASLMEALKNHRIAILLVIGLFVSSCAQNVSGACPVPRQWSDKQQDEIEANLSTLSPDSPLIAVGVEWARLRAESRACLQNGD